MPFEYIKDPQEIYDLSFQRVARSADFSQYTEGMKNIVQRVVHASAEPKHIQQIDFHPDFECRACNALSHGSAILVDCEMVKSGVTQSFITRANPIICTLNEPDVPILAKKLKTTRSAAAVELWKPYLKDAVIVIGNAPTALFHLLEIIHDKDLCPAVIIGLPVGFVGAQESKKTLSLYPNVPAYFTLHGRHGGSAMAAAVINALLLLTKNTKD